MLFTIKLSLNEAREKIRIAIAVGAKGLQKLDVNQIEVGAPDAATEDTSLVQWRLLSLKIVEIIPLDEADRKLRIKGETMLTSRNCARNLEQCPPNIMTPNNFVQVILKAGDNILCTEWSSTSLATK